jgi:glycosyltransferase involved in cell wall biosynthesis
MNLALARRAFAKAKRILLRQQPKEKPLFYTAPRAGRSKRVLLHYKTDSFANARLAETYAHTNFWEVIELVRILNSYGFEVDVLDRSHHSWKPEGDIYDLVISNASGNSGQYFIQFAPLLPRAKKIFYALGPAPDIANTLVLGRYARHTDIPPMRVMDKADLPACMALTDYIFCLDDNGFSTQSYARENKPIFRISPSLSPRCHFDPEFIKTRDTKNFLCFTGDGFIAKGVDLLVEAMEDLPKDFHLYIAGPPSEQAFFEKYNAKIEQLGNIHYVGFLEIGSPAHLDLVKKCAYVILPTAAEGLATSVATSMKFGMVPILTFECGVDASSCGFYCSSHVPEMVSSLRALMQSCATLSPQEYKEKVYKTVEKSAEYGQSAFTQSWNRALSSILEEI